MASPIQLRADEAISRLSFVQCMSFGLSSWMNGTQNVLTRNRLNKRPRGLGNFPCARRRTSHIVISASRGEARGGGSGEREVSSPSVEEWQELIVEFEERHKQAQSGVAPSSLDSDGEDDEDDPYLKPPEGRPLGRENPALYEQLPVVESAMMTAATAVMWFYGRVIRLDSLIMLFYPLPGFYIMMRWGPYYGNITALTSCMLIMGLLGPLYGTSYVLNTGLLAFAFGNALWYRWHWLLAILAGSFAKLVGIVLQIALTSALLHYNAWAIIGNQVKGLVDGIGTTVCRVLGRSAFVGPSISQVQFWVVVFLALHSAFHVVFTHLSSTMILDRLYDDGKLKRAPRMVPFLYWLKARVREKKLAAHGHPMYQASRLSKKKK
jgi:Predicted membrane protein (DUF2232)